MFRPWNRRRAARRGERRCQMVVVVECWASEERLEREKKKKERKKGKWKKEDEKEVERWEPSPPLVAAVLSDGRYWGDEDEENE